MQTEDWVSEQPYKKYFKIYHYMWQKLQKTNVMLFHSKFYYFHQFIVKNYSALILVFAILLKKIFLSFFCKLLQANMMIGCRVMTKMQRPLIVMKFSLSILSLFRIRKKERKMKKIAFIKMFSVYLQCTHVLTENISQN
jgi:hypothetical protein